MLQINLLCTLYFIMGAAFAYMVIRIYDMVRDAVNEKKEAETEKIKMTNRENLFK